MPISHAFLLGVVQGITEFLPISSSAHLILFPWFLGWPEHSLAFDVALHVGTLLAILLYFAGDFIKLLSGVLHRKSEETRFLAYLVLGTVPAALAGLFGEKIIEGNLRAYGMIACTLIGVGILLWLADARGKKSRNEQTISWKDAVLIGCAQACALIPGVSRSGITMTVALFLGLTRPAAARFSFLLAAPLMLAAGIFEGRKILGGLPVGETWLGWGLGLVTSAITGIIVIRFLMKYLQEKSFRPFIIYRIALGVGIAAFLLLK